MAGYTITGPTVFLILVILAGLAIYFLPTIIAFWRGHHQRGAVLAINLFLGWTLLGWVVALAMAMSAHRQPQVMIGFPTSAQVVPQAGWYPDPQQPGMGRYWDGRQWTGHQQPTQ